MTTTSRHEPPARDRRPLRVLQVVDGLGAGGAQTLVLAYATLGPRWRVSMVVAGIAPDPDEALARRLAAAAAGFSVVGHDATWDPRLLAALVSLIRRERIDLVHTHLAGADIAGGLAARLMRRPVVSSLHAVAEHRLSYTLRRRLLANAATRWLPDAVIAVSESTRDSHVRVVGLDPGSVTVIPNAPAAPLLLPEGFDREAKRRELGLDGPTVVMVARLDAQKDHDTLVRGVPAVLERHPDVRVLVVGDGPRRGELADLIRSLGLGDRVRLLGLRPDAVEIMAASDVACQLTLDLEGIPVALLDGMALGLPSIGSAARGTDEVVEDGRSGLLVAQGDPQAFSRALLRLLSDADLRARLGAEARRRVDDHFGLDRWMSATCAVYDRVLARRGH